MSPTGATAGLDADVVDAFVDVLSQGEDDPTADVFYSRLCEAICRLTAMERAVIFRYDETRRRVRAAGAHGLDLGLFADLQVTVESAPIALRALREDRVVEVRERLEEQVPPRYAGLLRDTCLACTPIAAGGRWVGVVLSDRSPDGPPLTDAERHLLWTLGKTAALAAIARIATRQAENAHQLQSRIDMAREIHDRVIQRLFGVSLALAADGALSDDARRRAAGELQEALTELRRSLGRPLGRAPRETRITLGEELERLAREHPDLGLVVEGPPPAVPAALEPVAQSVLIEAVRNAHKHACPRRVAVRAGVEDGAFVLTVRNDGVSGGPRRTGMGLRLAALDALQCGGVVEFGERPAGTWEVKLVVPHDGR